MKILIVHSSNFDCKKELYKPILDSNLSKLHDFILPHEKSDTPYTKPLMENNEIDIVIAEVSYPSTGEGIEIGWADVYNIPVYAIYKSGSKYSAALKLVCKSFKEYKNNDEMLKIINDIILNY
ncbi:MAG TPA: hypothetical protein VK338_05145 [Candidatus Nitrosocosmicus sp.]|nr:hypothetical protein [Candidatus Nitrosocosmicus sp.]